MRAPPAGFRAASGFSLLELVVTIAIIGILLGVAVPSYREYVDRGKRAAARSALVQAAAFLERSYTTNGCYNRTSVSDCQPPQAGDALVLPPGLARAPTEGRQSYVITLNATSQAYELRATPCRTAGNCPAGSDPFEDSRCEALTLTQTGLRGATKPGADIALCWQR